MTHLVRLATQHDASELAAIRWMSRSTDEQGRESAVAFARRFQAWLNEALTSNAWHAVVAERSSRIVGCMYLRIVDTVPVPGQAHRAWGYVTHAFVRSEHRRLGIGTALLNALVSEARSLKLKELQVWPSNEAISLYSRAGFMSAEQLRAAPSPEEASYVLELRS